jgi:hypothetical protein
VLLLLLVVEMVVEVEEVEEVEAAVVEVVLTEAKRLPLGQGIPLARQVVPWKGLDGEGGVEPAKALRDEALVAASGAVAVVVASEVRAAAARVVAERAAEPECRADGGHGAEGPRRWWRGRSRASSCANERASPGGEPPRRERRSAASSLGLEAKLLGHSSV